MGGGSDREQDLIAADLDRKKDNLWSAIEAGVPILAICGGYQLLGKYYRTLRGRVIPGLGLLDFYTQAGVKRLIGNIAVKIKIDGHPVKVTGFENHGGQTFLGDGVKPFGKVLVGFGNNGQDGFEGARYRNVICSYLHGPLLPKNPQLTDYFLKLALKRRGWDHFLSPLDDRLEEEAGRVMLTRMGIME